MTNKPKILILDADSSAGLASIQALGSAGREVHVGVRARGSLAESSRWPRSVHQQPDSLPMDGAISWLQELDADYGFHLIIPATESSLLWIRSFPEDHVVRKKSIVSCNATIDTALNKETVLALAKSLGIPVPRSRLLTSHKAMESQWSFPTVLKPVRSKVENGKHFKSYSVCIARNAEAKDLFLRKNLSHTDIQEQEWVAGSGVGVEVLYDCGKLVWHFVHRRLHEWPLTGGASSLRIAAPDNPVLVDYSRQLLDALQWHGVAMVEWRCTPDGKFYFIELNPRLWGSLPLTIAAGVNIPEGLLLLSQGQKLPVSSSWDVGLSARNFAKDLTWTIANAKADRCDKLLLTEDPTTTIIGWLRALTGREIWDGWSLKDPSVAIEDINRLLIRSIKIIRKNRKKEKTLRLARVQYRKIFEEIQGGHFTVNSLLFICYGNICRSPFASLIARSNVTENIKIESAGFYPEEGRMPPSTAIQAAARFEVDLGAAVSKIVTNKHVSEADLILVMDISNYELILKKFPDAINRTIFLGVFEKNDEIFEISDPYDMSTDDTEIIFAEISRCVQKLGLAINQGRREGVDSRQK